MSGFVADPKRTLPCTYLSAVLLVGLLANLLFGWSGADLIAALAIAAIAVKEGWDTWQGKGYCAPDVGHAPTKAEADACGRGDGCSGCRETQDNRATTKPIPQLLIAGVTTRARRGPRRGSRCAAARTG